MKKAFITGAEKAKAAGAATGRFDIETVIAFGLKTPGIRISRSEFLTKEFAASNPGETVGRAVSSTPLKAGISPETIDKTADNVIRFERSCVSGISAALGMPGGFAAAAAIPADIVQYYGYTLRTAQKLMYLYGFPEIEIKDGEANLSSETLNLLILCLGVMYGVAGASNAIKAMANALAKGVEKKLLNTALTKGAVYPVVKSVAKWFGIKMTKDVFAGFFKKAVPAVGGIVGGGLTFVAFGGCCKKLKSALRDTLLSNPNHQETEEETIVLDGGATDG